MGNMMQAGQEEQSFLHQLDVEVSYLNEQNIMKPSAYQALFAQLAERHLAVFGADANVTMQYDLSWALISISIDVVKPIDHCMRLYAKTWYSGRKGPFYRRELVFYDEENNIRFQGSTFSVLLELSSRSIYRKKELPFALTEPSEVFCIDAEPRFREDLPFSKVDERRVYNSYIDNLGHVNNRHYGDFAFDVLTEEELAKMPTLSRMDFYFIAELRNHDLFSLEKAQSENHIFVRGQNILKEELAFVVQFHLREL